MNANERVRIMLSPIATPLPLTFVGLLLGSLVLSGLDLGWIDRADAQDAGWVLIAVPLPLQLVAALFGFHGRSATAATGSSTLAAAWLAIALQLITTRPGAPLPSHAVSLLCIGVAAALVVPAVADAGSGFYLASAVVGVASLRFLLTGVDGFAGGIGTLAGIVGLAAAALSFYAALAIELEAGRRGRPSLPTFRRPPSAAALLAPLEQQLDEIEHEAGVRRSL